jgi:AcrR family transcriptional regulator
MARKCKEETEKTYGLLVDAAEHVFSRKGYAGTTLQEIADQAGLTRGAVYWHFTDKHELLNAVLRRAQLPWDRLPDRFDSREDAPNLAQMAEVIGNALNEVVNDPRQQRVSLILLQRTELVNGNHSVCRRIGLIHERIKAWLVASLSWHCHNPDGTPHRNIPIVASAVKALLTGVTYESLLGQAQIDLANVTKTVEHLFTSFLSEPTQSR